MAQHVQLWAGVGLHVGRRRVDTFGGRGGGDRVDAAGALSLSDEEEQTKRQGEEESLGGVCVKGDKEVGRRLTWVNVKINE